MSIIYFCIAIFTTTLGALTGMGGGVIIKPVLDILGHFDTSTIGVLSSFTVFAMAVISVYRHYRAHTKVDLKIVVPLAIGSIFGGTCGQCIFDYFLAHAESPSIVVSIQNILLGLSMVMVFVYMFNKAKFPPKHLTGYVPSVIVGFCLGVISSFLGIGGGPINVVAFVYLFGYDTKVSAISSIVTILFAQISKLSLVLFTTGFGIYDLSVLPFMIVGAIMGGYLGSKLVLKLAEEQINRDFNYVTGLVFLICVYNVFANIF